MQTEERTTSNINNDSSSGGSHSTHKSGRSGWAGAIREFVLYVAVAAAILLPFRAFIAKPYIVSGASMSPTFETGHYLIIDEISYIIREPRRGEVAVFIFPGDHSKSFIKRVIGLPGETVIIKNGKVSIKPVGGEEFVLDEPYVKIESKAGGVFKLSEDEYFAMGDNRLGSYDSRTWGAIHRKDFVGRALLQLLPISKISTLPGDSSVSK